MLDKTQKLKILSTTATGIVVPHTMSDLHETLRALGYELYVQDIAGLPDYGSQVVALADGFVSVQPDIFITIDCVSLLPTLIALLNKPPKVISWFYDNPMGFLTDEFLCINSNYHLFCWDESYLPELKRHGFAHVNYQPFATNDRIYRPPDTIHYQYDVSFVGTFSEVRGELIHYIAEKGIVVDVFGDEEWNRVQHPNIHFHGFASNREECPLIYASSRINLNITNPQLMTALPVRVFDVMASGGFLLTDDRADARRLYKPEHELVIYHSAEELCTYIQHYLKAKDERESIRNAGYQKTINNYTFRSVLSLLLRNVTTEPVVDVKNTTPSQEQLIRMLQIVGLSYVKCRNYMEAYTRLTDALRLSPTNEVSLLSLAFLAQQTHQMDTYATCLKTLETQACTCRQIIQKMQQGPESLDNKEWWHVLYGMIFKDILLAQDGYVAGWFPKKI